MKIFFDEAHECKGGEKEGGKRVIDAYKGCKERGGWQGEKRGMKEVYKRSIDA